MKPVKVVIFDCDGVMFDTAAANRAFYNQILRDFNQPELTSEQFAYIHMHTVDEAISYLFDGEMMDAVQTYRKNMSYFPFIKHMEIDPDLKSVLTWLRSEEYKTSIATNRTDTMDRVLEEHGLEGYFDLIVTARDVGRPKPHPDQLVRIMQHFGIEPYEALYVGDSVLDEQAARAAHVPFAGFKNKELTADYHINTMGEIEDILKDEKGHFDEYR